MNQVLQSAQALINRSTPDGVLIALGVSAFLLLLGIALMVGRRWWPGLGLGVVGLFVALVGLLIVDVQRVTFRESESVTVTRPRYPERTRAWARSGMIGLPALLAFVGLTAWASSRRRRRRSVPVLLRKGRLELFSRDFERALATYSRAIRISPFLAEAYCGRGAAYQGLGDIDRALDDYNKAVQYDPRSAHAFLQRARLRTETGDFEGALADLNRLMELQPNDPELYLCRGVCAMKKGMPGDAAADFHRVLKLTNHSDFAEPAKEYLLQIEGHPAALRPPMPQANGTPDRDALPEPRAHDPRH